MNKQIYYIVDMCREGHITDFEAVELIVRERLELKKKSMVKKLWQEFGAVPMDPETERIEKPWKMFPAGTHREDIWHWFEDTFGISVAEDLMGQRKETV